MNKNDLNKVEEGYYGNKDDYYDKQDIVTLVFL